MSLKKNLHFNSHMGRMGNQMFQYACAKNLDFEHGFTTSMSHLDKLEYFELMPNERFINRVKSFLFFRLSKAIWGMKVLNTDLACLRESYLERLVALNEPTLVWGFFQSEDYFRYSADRIKQAFKVKEQYRKGLNDFLSQHGLKQGGYTVIHVRRTDYKGFTVPGLQGDDFTLPVSYYHNAIAQLSEEARSLPFVFVSDDPDSIDELFPDVQNKIISRGDVITDFLILSSGAHLVVSNSTFAWWAAYLAPHSGAKVYCPKYFLGFKEDKEIPVRIYPEHWTQVPVMSRS